MDIALYIADLLRQHNAVNVPSLGIFYNSNSAAFYDHSKAVLFPPSRTVSFKDEHDDSMILAEYISSEKHVSNSTSLYFIDKFVTFTKSLVTLNGQADIHSLGILKKSGDGYVLIDAPNLDALGEYYGLFPVKESKPDIPPHTETVATLPPNAVTEDFKIPEVTNVDSHDYEEQIEETDERLSTSGIFLIVAGFLIIAGIIGFLAFPQSFNFVYQRNTVPVKKITVKKPFVAPVPMTMVDSLNQADTIYKELSKQGFEVEKPRDTLLVTTKIKPPAPPLDKVTYEIIGAAFARRNEAENYVKQLQNKGLYAKIVDNMPGSKLKISLGTFNYEASAQRELVRIKRDINKEAWVARVKQKKTNK
ncbi:MAG: SPOR domain-containing protein [Flavobacterium sp.]|nr:SPOR domain-containing protein [Pedobacter sp.]